MLCGGGKDVNAHLAYVAIAKERPERERSERNSDWCAVTQRGFLHGQ